MNKISALHVTPKNINTKEMLTKKVHATFLLVCPLLTFFLAPRNNIIFIRVISLAYCANWTMRDYFIEQWKHFLANWDYLIIQRQYMHFIRYNLGQKVLRFCTFVPTERLSRGFGAKGRARTAPLISRLPTPSNHLPRRLRNAENRQTNKKTGTKNKVIRWH